MDQHRWRFWPVILLAIFYPMNMNLLGLAIPLYFFRRAVPTEIIGILISATTVTYSISPLLLSGISERLPRKTSVVIGMAGAFLTQLIFYITLHPIPFLIARLCEGFIVGFFWTNLQASISDNVHHRHRKLTALYNLSWNMGLILGLILGAILTFLASDLRIVFYFAPVFLLVNVVIAWCAFQEPQKFSNGSEFAPLVTEEGKKNPEDDLNIIEQPLLEQIEFPRYYPFLLAILYALVRSSFKFLFPIKSEILGFDTYTVYIASIFFALSQCLAMFVASSVSLKYLEELHLLIILSLLIFTPLFGFNTNYYIFIIIFLIIGCCTGLLYGISLRLVLILNMRHERSVFSAALESVVGICFLLAPFFAGYLTYISLDFPVYILTVVLALFSFLLIFLIQKHISVK